MKTLVMSLAIAASGLFNTTFAANPTQRFAYNMEEGEDAQIQYVYKVTEDGRYLRHHLKYRCTYDDAHRLLAKEILRWDDASAKYCPAYALHYAYGDDSVTVECARWCVEEQAYTDVREKVVYASDVYGLTYQAYEYDAESGAWQLTNEHEAKASLLAER